MLLPRHWRYDRGDVKGLGAPSATVAFLRTLCKGQLQIYPSQPSRDKSVEQTQVCIRHPIYSRALQQTRIGGLSAATCSLGGRRSQIAGWSDTARQDDTPRVCLGKT